jgi:GAF domain-containing protein
MRKPRADLEQQLEKYSRKLAEARQHLAEALERQAATSEVLRVISSLPGELEPVFQSVLENATRLCEAKFGTLYLREGQAFRLVAHHNAPAAYVEERRRNPLLLRPIPGSALGRVVATKQPAQIADVQAEPVYHSDPVRAGYLKLTGARTLTTVPMLKENELIGAIAIYRQEVRTFTEKQIELVQNFAAQAVIAIENTRLLNELRHRTDDLSEAFEQQTALSKVLLGIISSSPTDLAAVFSTILASATRLCEGNLAVLWRYDGEALVGAAHYNATPEFAEQFMSIKFAPGRAGPARLAALERRTIHVADITVEPGFSPVVLQYENARTVLAVPLLRETDLVGVISMWRREVRPFTDKQIELLTNFAAQAVIAIENTRLLNELRQRTDDLGEALEQQTATSEVLQVISGSPGELEPVFQAMLANATRICEAKFGTLWLCEGDAFRAVALHNAPPAYAKARRRELLLRPPPDTALGRVATTKEVVQIDDIRGQIYDPEWRAAIELGNYRTVVSVPMLKDNELIGAISIFRQEVCRFTDKQVDLLRGPMRHQSLPGHL